MITDFYTESREILYLFPLPVQTCTFLAKLTMRKKLDTRFPAARIKKIMQADEEVGKIASATPVLISKALELFLQDLCNRTYEITLRRGAKTMNSHHLKECVRNHSVFDFLKETVSRVPDIDPESAGGDSGRRRKAVEGENDDSGDEDVKRSRPDLQSAPSRGRGRGRGRGRKSNSERARAAELDKFEENEAVSSPQVSEDGETSSKSPADEVNMREGGGGEASGAAKEPLLPSERCPKNFDLNMELDENGEVAAAGVKEEEDNSQWLGPPEFQGFGADGVLHQDQNVFQPDEDYDCEDEE